MPWAWKYRVLASLPVIVAAGFLFLPVIEQPDWYHAFADRRSGFGIPNFGDVISNVAFLVVGVFGVWQVRTARTHVGAASWSAMFAGVICVSAGSAYYHLAPANGPLVWDRLPMTIAFTAMTVAIVTEFVSSRFERFALFPVIAVGASSVLVWHLTGDLRFYFWVQVTSVAVVLFSIFAFGRNAKRRGYILAAGVLYGVAILCEQLDHQIFAAFSGNVSGHTLKHLFAAAGLFMFPLRLRQNAAD